ncbi:phosphoribosyltransferase [Candidatus Poribacteria bacterium]|nr:phosphoribosyltransferase [Candidatus Poribacteria bacterium]
MAKVFDLPRMRDKIRVFRDRNDAGKVLAGMMESYRRSNSIVLAIPAGGVPVASVIAGKLNLVLDLAVTSKIILPWNSEVGYGAVTFDGTVKLNEELISNLKLTPQTVEEGIKNTQEKVQRRIDNLRGDLPIPAISKHTVILVDDGLASGFTMKTAVEAVRKLEAERIVVAVPTAHYESMQSLIQKVNEVYCPNIRKGWRYAVADAYKYWSDIEEKELEMMLDKVM